VLDDRIALEGKFTGGDDQHTIEDILRVGTSAGGARAKAVLAWSPATGEFRSGQAPAASSLRKRVRLSRTVARVAATRPEAATQPVVVGMRRVVAPTPPASPAPPTASAGNARPSAAPFMAWRASARAS
jgi:hypothetical protein